MDVTGYGCNGVWMPWYMDTMGYGCHGIWMPWDMDANFGSTNTYKHTYVSKHTYVFWYCTSIHIISIILFTLRCSSTEGYEVELAHPNLVPAR